MHLIFICAATGIYLALLGWAFNGWPPDPPIEEI